MNELNPSVKPHMVIGFFISVWLFLFAFFIRPFDDGTINLKMWIFISVGFSLLAFLSYGAVSVVQKRVHEKVVRWTIGLEISSLVFFQLLFLISTYGYYKIGLHGGFGFIEFLGVIILKSALVSTPILILLRIYAVKLLPVKEDILIMRGENRLDILRIKKADLVCISNSQNYVEIFFIAGNQLKSKLIRSTLKKMQHDFDFLIQVHRSHLINPTHFKTWKSQDVISLTEMEVPVSKNYKALLLSL